MNGNGMTKVLFSASGFGTRSYDFALASDARFFMRNDAEATAADCGGEVQLFGDDEVVVANPGGEEIARWWLEK